MQNADSNQAPGGQQTPPPIARSEAGLAEQSGPATKATAHGTAGAGVFIALLPQFLALCGMTLSDAESQTIAESVSAIVGGLIALAGLVQARRSGAANSAATANPSPK